MFTTFYFSHMLGIKTRTLCMLSFGIVFSASATNIGASVSQSVKVGALPVV